METDLDRDIMLVCLGGHVITDTLLSRPEHGLRHCDRCGAATLSRCPTCGEDLPGATPVTDLSTIGERRAPQNCPSCGVAFPWARRPTPAEPPDALELLAQVLRRVPTAIRQFRDRHHGRPTLCVQDVFDLEDLLRAILHMHFDEVRRETRTPDYASGTRTDFLVSDDHVAVAAKLATAHMRERELVRQMHEDIAYYEKRGFDTLAVLIYDPEQVVRDVAQFEASWSAISAAVDVRCIVAS